jgi:hypothetical protein
MRPDAKQPPEEPHVTVQRAEASTAAPEPSDALTLSEAVTMLPDSPRVHTWKNDGLGVFPSYLPRADVIGLMEQHGVKRAPAAATRLTHGLLVEFQGVKLFIQTKEAP